MNTPQTRRTGNDPSFVKRIALVGAGVVIALGVGTWMIGDHEPVSTAKKAESTEKTRTNASRPAWAKETSSATTTVASETGNGPIVPAVVETVEAAGPAEIAAAPVEPVEPVRWEDAQAAWDAGDKNDAVRLFTQYAEERPDNPWGHYMKGLSLRRDGNFEEAEQALVDCLAIDAEHPKALVNLARVRLDLERPADAREPAELAVKLDLSNGAAHRVLGRTYHSQGLRDLAESEYLKAISLDPEDGWSYNNLGLLRIEEERFEEAVAPLMRACGVDEGQARYFNNLGIALERVGRYRAAEVAFRDALEADPEYERSQISLARVTPLGAETDEPLGQLAVFVGYQPDCLEGEIGEPAKTDVAEAAEADSTMTIEPATTISEESAEPTATVSALSTEPEAEEATVALAEEPKSAIDR